MLAKGGLAMLLGLCALLTSHHMALADEPVDGCGVFCDIDADDDRDAIRGAILIPGDGFQGPPGLRTEAATCVGCSWQTAPWCLDAEPGGDTMCLGALIGCPVGSERYALFLRRPGEPTYTRVGSFCRGPGQPLTPSELVPEVRDRFIEYLPPQAPSYQPVGGALVNLAAVFSAGQSGTIGRPTFDLAGFEIALTAEAAWRWDFADGPVEVFAVPGGPYPDTSVSHVYRTPGQRTVTVTTLWAGDFTVDGLGPFPVEGPPVTQTAALPVLVREARAELVDG